MQSRERNHIDSEFTKIGVELTRESKACSNAGHNKGDKMVKITVCGGVQFQRSEADVVESLIVDTEGLIRVFDKLVNGERSVVRLNNCVRDLQKTSEYTSTTNGRRTLGDGMTEKVHIIRSGYSSRIFEMRRVPIPAPVPPPREWVI